jgi:ethanolamine ammonia-lyase small subunit
VTGPDPWAALRLRTPARIGLGHVGGSLPTTAHLAFQLAHARARDAVHRALDVARLLSDLRGAGFGAIPVRSAAANRLEYLERPDLGRRLHPESRAALEPAPGAETETRDAVFVVADGLSAAAAQRHAVPVLGALIPTLLGEGWRVPPVIVAEQGRVALGDEIGELLGGRLVAVFIGERPGLSSPDSLGIYLTWEPRLGRTDADRNCISNVRPDGLAYALAAEQLEFLMTEARRRRLTGIGLKPGGLPGKPAPLPERGRS